MNNYIKDILKLLGSDKKRVHKLFYLFIGASLIDVIGLGLISPYISLISGDGYSHQILGSYFVNTDSDEIIIVSSVVLLVVFILKSIISLLINWKIIDFSLDQQLSLRSLLMKSYQFLPYVEHIDRNSASNIYHIQQLTNQYSMQVLIPVLRATGEAVIVLFIVVFLAWTNLLALLLLFFLLSSSLFIYDRVFLLKIRAYGEEANKASVTMVKSVQESFIGLKEIRVLGKEKYLIDIFKNSAYENAYYIKRSQIFSTIPRYMFELIIVVFVVFVTLLSTLTDQNPEDLASLLAVFGVASLRLIPAANLFSNSLTQLRYNRDTVSRLVNDLKMKEKLDKKNTLKSNNILESTFKEIQLNNIIFSYKNLNTASINNISLKISMGEMVGIIGDSGSGKTTLVDLILGLLKPQSGEILYNKSSLDETIQEWRSQVAYLPQKAFLIDDTIKSNVAFGVDNDALDEQLLWESIKKARLHDFVKTLPNGLSTMVGEGGDKLSGGQRQRVALARAFYCKRDVLIMDEATSALDPNTEERIMSEISDLRGKMTIIIITHKMKNIESCDRVYELKAGCISVV